MIHSPWWFSSPPESGREWMWSLLQQKQFSPLAYPLETDLGIARTLFQKEKYKSLTIRDLDSFQHVQRKEFTQKMLPLLSEAGDGELFESATIATNFYYRLALATIIEVSGIRIPEEFLALQDRFASPEDLIGMLYDLGSNKGYHVYHFIAVRIFHHISLLHSILHDSIVSRLPYLLEEMPKKLCNLPGWTMTKIEEEGAEIPRFRFEIDPSAARSKSFQLTTPISGIMALRDKSLTSILTKLIYNPDYCNLWDIKDLLWGTIVLDASTSKQSYQELVGYLGKFLYRGTTTEKPVFDTKWRQFDIGDCIKKYPYIDVRLPKKKAATNDGLQNIRWIGSVPFGWWTPYAANVPVEMQIVCAGNANEQGYAGHPYYDALKAIGCAGRCEAGPVSMTTLALHIRKAQEAMQRRDKSHSLAERDILEYWIYGSSQDGSDVKWAVWVLYTGRWEGGQLPQNTHHIRSKELKFFSRDLLSDSRERDLRELYTNYPPRITSISRDQIWQAYLSRTSSEEGITKLEVASQKLESAKSSDKMVYDLLERFRQRTTLLAKVRDINSSVASILDAISLKNTNPR